MQAKDINGVVDLLDELLDDPKIGRTHLGLFPALYRQVTLEVREGVRDGVFEDSPRMERLDTIFANRYFRALDLWRRGRRPTRSWEVAFNYARAGRGVALQHLLLGMNAHINLDLGVSSAQVAPGESIQDLKRDFNTINALLASLLNGTQDALSDYSPLLHRLDRVAQEGDEAFANFSIAKARKASWATARSLAPVPAPLQPGIVEVLDRGVRNLGRLIARPGPLFSAALVEVKAAESDDIPAMVRRLNRVSALRSDPSAKRGGQRGKGARKGGARAR